MEVELKFSVPDQPTYEQLLSLTHLGDYWLRPAGEQHVTDHYYDTDQRSVLRGGYALRLRETAGHPEWLATLKGLAGGAGEHGGAEHEREEYETSIPPGALPQDWPAGEARDRALALAGDQPLHELFAIAQQRHKRAVLSGDNDVQPGGAAEAREAAELSLDVVHLPQDGQQQQTYELEIELRPTGHPSDLSALDEALAGYALAPQARSKFERALAQVNGERPPADGDLAAAPMFAGPEDGAPEDGAPQAGEALEAPAKKSGRPKTPGVLAGESMADAGRKVLSFHFQRMLDKEDGARDESNSDAVHDMRVATRRQRAALILFADHLKRKPARRFNRELKTLAHLLGAVRDLDVQLKAVQQYHDQLSGPAAEAIRPVLDAWTGEREAARGELLAYLDGPEYHDFKKAYKKFLDSRARDTAARHAIAAELSPSLVRQVLPGQLWEHYGEVRAYETVIVGAGVPTLHALRISSKALRYALEFFREVLQPADDIDYAIRSVVALQDHIGDLHDADVTIARLREFLGSRGEQGLSPETVMAVGQYMKSKQATLRRLQRGAARPWRAVSSARFRAILGRAGAGL